MTLIAFDLIYSEFSEGCPNPFLGVVTTPPAFIYYPPLIIPTTLFIKKFWKFKLLRLFRLPVHKALNSCATLLL